MLSEDICFRKEINKLAMQTVWGDQNVGIKGEMEMMIGDIGTSK